MDGLAPVLEHVARAAAGAEATDDSEHQILRAHALGEGAVDGDGHGLGFLLWQGLRGEYVLDLAGADAEGQ